MSQGKPEGVSEEKPDIEVTSEDDAEQAVWSFQQLTCPCGTAMPFFCEMLQPIPVERHHCCF